MLLYLPDGKPRHVPGDPRTIGSLLIECGINPLEVIVTLHGRPVPEDAIVSGDDEVRIIIVAHGG